MFRDKGSLYGLGAGMIIGAILLQLMTFARTDSEPAAQMPGATEEQLQAMAAELGYDIYPKSERRYTDAEVQEQIAKALEQERDDRSAVGLKVGETSEGTAVYLVVIEPGMGAQEVAEALALAGLIEDAGAFEDELSRRRLTRRIQIGSFTFVGKPEPSEIISAITSP